MLPRLMVVTDRLQLPVGRGLVDSLRECHAAGMRMVLVREHDLAAAARHALLENLASLAGLTVVSSRLRDDAAAGVQLSATAPSEQGSLVGRSCHSRAEVLRAARQGASYATLSPFAPGPSKPGHGPPIPGREYANLPIPTFALGGLEPHNARNALEQGAHGVAVMGAVMRAEDPGTTVADLLEAIR